MINRVAILFVCLVLCCCLISVLNGQRMSGKLAGRGRGNKSWHTGRIPPSIQHRSPSAVNYYDNKDGAKIVKASHFEFDYMLGRKITFFCEATGLPRPEIIWFKDGAELYQHRFFQVGVSNGNDCELSSAFVITVNCDPVQLFSWCALISRCTNGRKETIR